MNIEQNLTAPRVTEADVEASIASEHYFTAAQGCVGCVDNVDEDASADQIDILDLLTFCVLIMRNGTKIVGINHGAIDPAQHDSGRGRREAREDAIRQVWPLLGYALRERLAVNAEVAGSPALSASPRGLPG